MRSRNDEPVGTLIAAVVLVGGLAFMASIGPAEPAGQPAVDPSRSAVSSESPR
jgi:hypothetical protein